MPSNYIGNLSAKEFNQLIDKLLKIQNNTCFICGEAIDRELHPTNIDHILPLANGGRDREENFAITHDSCNKSKQDADLNIARMLHKIKKIQEAVQQAEHQSATLKHVLENYNGSKFDFKFKISDDTLKYSFSELGDNTIYETKIHTDFLSQEQTCFIELPIEYLFHDELINPRGINSSISKLVKEFDKKRPQLHLSLGRFDNGKIKVFDGQHKSIAQILLGSRSLLLRIFLNPDVNRLQETNTNAGSSLAQIAFPKHVLRQLNNTLYNEKIKEYQSRHNLKSDDFSFSEQNLASFFSGDKTHIKKYIIDAVKHSITESRDNKLKDYIDREGKSKELPISYSAFDKSFLSIFIDGKQLLKTPIYHKVDEGENPRELEISQMIRLLNIIADEIYVNKFIPEIGVSKIENKIVEKKDNDITDDHLIAYRMSKEEILSNWLIYIQKVIENYFSNTGRIFNQSTFFQEKFDDQLWKNITQFIKNLRSLPLWRDRSMAGTIFSGKKNYDYWRHIFEQGKTPDNVPVLAKPLNYIEMIKR